LIGKSNAPGERGLIMHNALVFTPSGVPLGLLSQCIWARGEIPEEDYRRFKERKANRRRPPEATTEDYLASETLSQYGGPGRPIHFKAPGHSVRYEARPAGERSR